MSDRDELADLIKPAAAHDYWPQKAAELVLAAGYRKPRQVTTVEELDALPTGAVVLANNHRHYLQDWRLSFQKWDDGDWHRGARSGSTHPDNFLPATVLHVGGAA